MSFVVYNVIAAVLLALGTTLLTALFARSEGDLKLCAITFTWSLAAIAAAMLIADLPISFVVGMATVGVGLTFVGGVGLKVARLLDRRAEAKAKASELRTVH